MWLYPGLQRIAQRCQRGCHRPHRPGPPYPPCRPSNLLPHTCCNIQLSVTMNAYMMVCNATCHQVFIVCTAVYKHDRDKAVSYIAAKGSARGITVRICQARHTLGLADSLHLLLQRVRQHNAGIERSSLPVIDATFLFI